MEYLRQTIASAKLSDIYEIPPALRNRNVQVIILLAEDTVTEQLKPQKRQLGFAKGAEIPDSFFERLSEEEL